MEHEPEGKHMAGVSLKTFAEFWRHMGKKLKSDAKTSEQRGISHCLGDRDARKGEALGNSEN